MYIYRHMYACVRVCACACVYVLYYIVKGILAETLVFGARGEQECWAVYFRWRIHLQTLDYFLSTPVYRKTKLRPQSRVLTTSTKKGTEFSEGWGEGDNFLFKNTEARDICSSVRVLLSTVCLSQYTNPPSRFPLLLSSSSSLGKCVSFL